METRIRSERWNTSVASVVKILSKLSNLAVGIEATDGRAESRLIKI